MAERYIVTYRVLDTKTDEFICDEQSHVIIMSDAELDTNGLIKEKLKIAGRIIGKALLGILKQHVTDIKGNKRA